MPIRTLASLIVSVLVSACHAGPTPPSNAPVQIQAKWRGTFAAGRGDAFPITASITQSHANVGGHWLEPQWLDYSGTISGTVDSTTFTGTLTLNGSSCQATFSGPSTSTSLNWSSTGFSGDCPIAPGTVTLTLAWDGPYAPPASPFPPTVSPQPFH